MNLAAMNFALLLLSALPPFWCAAVFLRPPFPKMFGFQACVPGLLCGAWGMATLFLAVVLPDALIMTGIAGVALGTFIGRGWLAAFLVRRPLPPGSMSFARGVRGLADRSFYLTNFAAKGPVFKTTQFGAPIICVAGMERIGRLMREHTEHLGPSPLAFTESIMGNFLRYMDGQTHAKYGPLFRQAMAGEAPTATHLKIRAAAQQMLEALARPGFTNPRPALLAFTRKSLNWLLFGFPGDDDRSRRFEQLAERFYASSIGQALSRADRHLLEEMESILIEQLRCSASGGESNDPVIARIRALDPSMPDRVCLDNLVLMHKIATNNVSSLLLWLFFYWGSQPEIAKKIRLMNDQDRPAGLNAFLFEALRLSQSEYLYRKVVRGFDFEGFHFPEGWMVRSCIWESHRTAAALPGPDEFRLRLESGDYARSHFSPFGMGSHACKGAGISNLICRTFLAALEAQFDLRIADGEPFTRLMRHWSHWQPNPYFKVQCTARK